MAGVKCQQFIDTHTRPSRAKAVGSSGFSTMCRRQPAGSMSVMAKAATRCGGMFPLARPRRSKATSPGAAERANADIASVG